MDAVSYSHSAKQAQRIEKFIENPDSTSGVVTTPSVIAAGETITIPAGRTAVLPNTQVNGILQVDGEVFVPSGGTFTKESINIGAVTTDELTVLGTGAAKLPSGTSAQRPVDLLEGGYIRYNTELMSMEAYVNGAWGSVGGGTTGGGTDNVFYENDQVITADYTIPVGKNAMSAGDITINAGVTVTVSSGSKWSIV